MNEDNELITAGEAAEILSVTTDIPENKCITKGEFDDLVESIELYSLTVQVTQSGSIIKIDGIERNVIPALPNSTVTVEVTKLRYNKFTQQVQVTQKNQVLNVNLTEMTPPAGAYAPQNWSYGVGILATDGFIYEVASWPSSKTIDDVVGIAMKLGTIQCTMSVFAEYGWKWGSEVLITGGYYVQTETEALKDMAGKWNTQAIVYEFGNSMEYAARMCTEYEFQPGQYGYLPSLGELNQLYANAISIDQALIACGGMPLIDSSDDYGLIWSSTQHSAEGAWLFNSKNPPLPLYTSKEDDQPMSVRIISTFPE